MSATWQSVRTVVLMLAGPPLLLLLWAHLVRPIWPGLDWIAVIAAGLMGLAVLAAAPWTSNVRTGVAVAYILLGIAALPFLTLLAVCSTGDCL